MISPLFSVVLTTYSRPDFLRQSVASVFAQTIEDWELLIVDDAGPIHAKPETDDARVRVIRRQANGGLAASRNTGIDAARGKYVTFLDDDDLYMPDRLASVLPSLAESPVTVCWSRYFYGTGNGNDRILSGNVHDLILNAITPHSGATTVERSSILRFDESYEASQDVEWWIRMSAATRVETTAKLGYLIRQHSGMRHRNSRSARIDASLRMLTIDYPEYFSSHPVAAALRWKRVGLQAAKENDFRLARKAFVASFRSHPDTRTLLHLASAIPRRNPSAHRTS